MSAVWLDENVLIKIHAAQIAHHGGMDGLRDWEALQACVAAPFQGFGRVEFYRGPALPQRHLV